MANYRESSPVRMSSLLPIGSNISPSKSDSGVTGLPAQNLRPLPSSNGPGSGLIPHHRLPSIELHIASSKHIPRNVRDTSPGRLEGNFRTPTSAIPSYSPQQPYLRPNSAYPSFSSPQWQNPSASDFNAVLSTNTAVNPDPYEEDVLEPPPTIAGTFSKRTSSLGSSIAGSIPRGRQDSRGGSLANSRASSPLLGSDGSRPTTPAEGKLLKKKTFAFDKSHNRAASGNNIGPSAPTWLVLPNGETQPYDISPLFSGQQVPDLWNTNGNTYIYLFPRVTGFGASFKVDSAILESSKTLSALIRGGEPTTEDRGRLGSQDSNFRTSNTYRHTRQASLGVPAMQMDSQPASAQRSSSADGGRDWDLDRARYLRNSRERIDAHLYIPLDIDPNIPLNAQSVDVVDRAVSMRNLFAFLTGGYLAGTDKQRSLFAIFVKISASLNRYGFTNSDGTTFGLVAAQKFTMYTIDLQLDDVRNNLGKIIEAIVLGEKMKFWSLYNEGFVHGVGKWDSLMKADLPTFSQISNTTRTRMENAAMELQRRLKHMRSRLEDFEFPSLWAGIAASNSESKNADFKAWKASFAAMRKHTKDHYKARYGSWPPKAKSEKNEFGESGLNRLLLKEVYQDFSDLYDVLVDRTSLTTRKSDYLPDGEVHSTNPRIYALRKLAHEFDISSPPVQPPMPYDIPILPDVTIIRRDFSTLSEKAQAKALGKKLKSDDVNLALMQSINRDSVKVTPFLTEFMKFERQSAHGKSISEISDIRIGQWIFLYAVLQSLPLAVIDAPGLSRREGIESFLCAAPRGSAPWTGADENARRKDFYRTPDGALVALPPDAVDHSVEGVYRRSHCWQVAEQWASPAQAYRSAPVSQVNTPSLKPLPHQLYDGSYQDLDLPLPPPGVFGSRPDSPASVSPRSSVAWGLEALPVPPDIGPRMLPNGSRAATPDPSKNFDDILGKTDLGKKKKNK